MTRPDRILDFTSLTYRQREVPEGLPPLGKYKPLGKNDTVVIDTGSWQYRAGYASKDLPACTKIYPFTLKHPPNSGIRPISTSISRQSW